MKITNNIIVGYTNTGQCVLYTVRVCAPHPPLFSLINLLNWQVDWRTKVRGHFGADESKRGEVHRGGDRTGSVAGKVWFSLWAQSCARTHVDCRTFEGKEWVKYLSACSEHRTGLFNALTLEVSLGTILGYYLRNICNLCYGMLFLHPNTFQRRTLHQQNTNSGDKSLTFYRQQFYRHLQCSNPLKPTVI